MSHLNRIQSVVFNTAYNTNENLLICAPTGAGKTNIALLTVVYTIRQNIVNGVIKKDQFKVNGQEIWFLSVIFLNRLRQKVYCPFRLSMLHL